MSRIAGIVSAGALITFAAAPAALAQTETETTTAPPTTETTSSEVTTTAPPISETPTTTVTTTGSTTTDPTHEVTTTTTTVTPTSTSVDGEPPKDDYQDNTGHGFVGAGNEGVLVIACASGKIGPVSTQYLSVTGGPDQDESDGRYWNYTVRVVDAPAGTTTAKFSWTCDGVEGNGVVDFQQGPPPVTSTSASTSTSAATSSTAPITTATSSPAAAAAGNSAPKAQVKVAPKGGVETGFGGMAG
ncbi:hypothetical protein DMA12_32235 [Amycolatopsis balhimycina DSM 5908]|uniref:Secreted protein n=1 Tax=Amycolatopsis balhimycina DSM 5908 TaxID=1081091 RepID=A0A428W6Q6_AMYBA|nr:hypothetical protein DMA12_32235 [Amycolatopsis balhimycina DSM 5908]